MVLSETTIQGLIIKTQSGFFFVETAQGLVVCQLRGKLKRGRAIGDIAAIGDHVQVTAAGDGSGTIEEVEERERALVRLDPRPRGIYQQVLLANPDPKLRMLDRFLVVAEKIKVPVIIVANKTDLVNNAEEIFGIYTRIGYRGIYTAARAGRGVEELREVLTGKLSALAGPSGVGKSTLLNALQPGLGLAVNEISLAVNKGKHTTVARQLIPLAGGGYVADTPGRKSLALWDTRPEEIDAYFPELAPLVKHCQFSDCSHTHEPGCAVLAALAAGTIHAKRYDSYLRLRAG